MCTNRKKWKISECINNAEAFSQLTDHVFDDIRNSSDEELKDAKDIMKIIDARKHYKLVSTASPRANDIFGIKVTFRNTKTQNLSVRLSAKFKTFLSHKSYPDCSSSLRHAYLAATGRPIDKFHGNNLSPYHLDPRIFSCDSYTYRNSVDRTHRLVSATCLLQVLDKSRICNYE